MKRQTDKARKAFNVFCRSLFGYFSNSDFNFIDIAIALLAAHFFESFHLSVSTRVTGILICFHVDPKFTTNDNQINVINIKA